MPLFAKALTPSPGMIAECEASPSIHTSLAVSAATISLAGFGGLFGYEGFKASRQKKREEEDRKKREEAAEVCELPPDVHVIGVLLA